MLNVYDENTKFIGWSFISSATDWMSYETSTLQIFCD